MLFYVNEAKEPSLSPSSSQQSSISHVAGEGIWILRLFSFDDHFFIIYSHDLYGDCVIMWHLILQGETDV